MSEIRLIEFGSSDYQKMVTLRDTMLRKPLGLHFTSSYLQRDANDALIGYFEPVHGQPELIGCCILSPVDEELVQLRQMAVATKRQCNGIGRRLMEFAEAIAGKKGFTTLMLHARNTAIPFYAKLGYKIRGEEFREVGIPHFEMRKNLS